MFNGKMLTLSLVPGPAQTSRQCFVAETFHDNHTEFYLLVEIQDLVRSEVSGCLGSGVSGSGFGLQERWVIQQMGCSLQLESDCFAGCLLEEKVLVAIRVCVVFPGPAGYQCYLGSSCYLGYHCYPGSTGC